MNKINFNQTGGFPLETNTLQFLQNAYSLFNAFSVLAGDLTILQGCTVTGSSVSDGVVIINGEVLPFVGGVVASTVVIVETTESKTFEDGSSKAVYHTRVARFGRGTATYLWSDFQRVDNLQEVMDKLKTHTHKWSEITNKPTTFPASEHTHTWAKITEKPTTFPPATHTHSYNDLTDKPTIGKGQIVVAGKVRCYPRQVIKTMAGAFYVSADPRHSDWFHHHKITHNLGHTDYVVTGNIIGKIADTGSTIKLTCYHIGNNYCYVSTSDDDSANDADFHFMITSFR